MSDVLEVSVDEIAEWFVQICGGDLDRPEDRALAEQLAKLAIEYHREPNKEFGPAAAGEFLKLVADRDGIMIALALMGFVLGIKVYEEMLGITPVMRPEGQRYWKKANHA